MTSEDEELDHLNQRTRELYVQLIHAAAEDERRAIIAELDHLRTERVQIIAALLVQTEAEREVHAAQQRIHGEQMRAVAESAVPVDDPRREVLMRFADALAAGHSLTLDDLALLFTFLTPPAGT